MKNRFFYPAIYLSFWVVLFALFRGLFLLFHSDLTALLPFRLILGAFTHGALLDLSFASYLAVVPFLLVAASVVVPVRFTMAVSKYYSVICIVFVTGLTVTDFELFGQWGYRLDSSFLMYLATPREAFASASSSPLILLIAYLCVLAILACFIYLKTVHRLLKRIDSPGILTALLFVFFAVAMIVPIRGGFQLAPINQSTAYFSNDDFANQAAMNVPWGFFYSLRARSYDTTNPYACMDDGEADAIAGGFYRPESSQPTPWLIASEKPNVILILWESLTTKAVSSLGGVDGVTPYFDRLRREGILFSRCYANADRSAGGIVAILSGYPALPKQRIIKMPTKTASLPSLARRFNESGYTTSFYYGGELEFANIGSYLRNEKFSRIIGKDDFTPEDWNSKWGAHDHVVLERLLDDLDRLAGQGPFFSVVFTLSSHEPFEFPGRETGENVDVDTLFLNSLRYTDTAVSDFIGKLKSRPWYSNTLIVIIADHGHNRPGNSPRYDPAKYHIPMLWLGGAVSVRDTVVTRVCGQTDLAATLLNQVGITSQDFAWSRDVLNPETPSGVIYTFNDGVGLIDDRGCLLYDHAGQAFIRSDEAMNDSDRDLVRACLQSAYRDFLRR